jgi:phosphoserine phosphatase
MRLALFDLDNTLLAGDSDYEWGQFLIDRGILEREAYEAQNRAYFEQYAAGTLDIHEYLDSRCAPSPRTRRLILPAGTPISWQAASCPW